MRKNFVLACAALLLCAPGFSQTQKANYALAERFSAKKVNQMVFSTQITPNWFRDSDKFWYSWRTPQGTRYYIVDPAKGTRTEVFDMDRLAMQVTVSTAFSSFQMRFTGSSATLTSLISPP